MLEASFLLKLRDRFLACFLYGDHGCMESRSEQNRKLDRKLESLSSVKATMPQHLKFMTPVMIPATGPFI